MLYSQLEIDNIVDELVTAYSGQTIAFHGAYPGESGVPVAYYIERICGMAIPTTSRNIESYFTREDYQDKFYPKGTVMVWGSSHMAILMSVEGPNIVTVFEQNGSPETLPCSAHARLVNTENNTCDYVLIPIVDVELPLEPKKPYVLPQGAMKLPITEKKLFVRTGTPGYAAYSKALKGENPITKVSMGNYYIYRETAGMVNVTKQPGIAGFWINPNA